MKILILCALIGFATAQRFDPRCPAAQDARRIVHLPHPSDCDAFLTCNNGNAFEVRCPAGQHFNVRTNGCDSIKNARCVPPTETQPQPPRGQPLPQPPRGQPLPQPPRGQPLPQPPRGQQLPQQLPEQFPEPPPQIRIQPPRPFPPNSQVPSFPNPRPEIEHPDFLNCPPIDTPGRVVYFPYHLNCQQFYQCVDGRAVLLRCPVGTSWQLRGSFCDRTNNVICQTPRRPL